MLFRRQSVVAVVLQRWPYEDGYTPEIETKSSLQDAVAACEWIPGVDFAFEVNVYRADGVSHVHSFIEYTMYGHFIFRLPCVYSFRAHSDDLKLTLQIVNPKYITQVRVHPRSIIRASKDRRAALYNA
jgi:hypothetical protein